MVLRVSGKNLDIGESLRDHTRERARALLGRFFEGEPNGHVTVQPGGSGFRADRLLNLPTGMTLQAEGRAHDPYGVVNQAAERIEQRLRRYKNRLHDRHVPAGPGPAAPDFATSDVIEAPGEEEVEADFVPVVVAESRTALRPPSVSAAVLEFDRLGGPVLVFRHSTTAAVNVVYRRTDGHIGWIDPSGASLSPPGRT